MILYYNSNIARFNRSRRAHSHAQSTGSRVAAAAAVLLSPSSPTRLHRSSRRAPSSSFESPRSEPDASGGDGGSDAFYKRQRLHAAAATARPESTWVCVPVLGTHTRQPGARHPSPEFLRYIIIVYFVLLLCSRSVPTSHDLCNKIFFSDRSSRRRSSSKPPRHV